MDYRVCFHNKLNNCLSTGSVRGPVGVHDELYVGYVTALHRLPYGQPLLFALNDDNNSERKGGSKVKKVEDGGELGHFRGLATSDSRDSETEM